MKAIKITEGTMSTLDKLFELDKEVEVTDIEQKYLSDNFGDIFKFVGVKEKVEIAPKDVKAKADTKQDVKDTK